MKVLSLFDGMSCGRIALERAGITVDKYYRSEIDKYANIIAKKNYPDSIDLGDVQSVIQVPDIDLLIAGSPCQGFSFAGRQLNFDDPRSKLFFDFVRILKTSKPKYFLLENVKMKKEFQDIISRYLGVEPVEINSSSLSAQNRKRLYWANFLITQPEDKGILLKDIIFDDALFGLTYQFPHGCSKGGVRDFNKSPTMTKQFQNNYFPVKKELLLSEKALEYMDREVKGGRNHWDFKHHSDVRNEKSAAIVANFFKGVPYNVLKDWNCIRKFDPIECERLQTLPDRYTEGVSDTQRYKTIGNGWTVDVIAHILRGIS